MSNKISAFKILNTEPGRFTDEAKAALRKIACIDEVEADRRYLLEHVSEYDGLFIGLRNMIDKDVLARAVRLKCIVTPTTGLNHIDMDTANSMGITVLSLKGEIKFLESVTATAELTWGLLLALVRKIPTACQSVVAGSWVRDEFYGSELTGKTLGVLGYGRLGKMVAAYGRAFGMRVIVHDHGPISSTEMESCSLNELLRQSDVISVHLPLNNETKCFLSRERFSVIKPGAVLLNTARGEIVDESALLAALRDGRLSGAAVDVLTDEVSNQQDWLTKSALWAYAKNHDNLLIVPHIGGVTVESVEKTNRFMIEKLNIYLNTKGGQ